MDFKAAVANEILAALNASFGDADIAAADIAAALEVPPDTALGDYAFPCFRLSKLVKGIMNPEAKMSKAVRKELQKALMTAIPEVLAKEMSDHADFLSKVEAVNGYLNFFIDRATYAEKVIGLCLSEGERYGSDDSGAGKTVVLDYSSINIAKRFHIGHLSTTMIGNSLYRLHKFFGWNAVGVNHLGDWGTQFGKMIAAYKRWGDHDTVAAGGVDEMVKLYVRFNQEAKLDPALDDEGRAWFKKIEDGDPEALEIFGWFKSVTLKDAERVYDMLGVTFDSYAGESFYNDKMQPVIDALREKGLLKEDKGAQIVDLSDWGMPPALILRSDGATLYITRDLAAAKYRKDTYHFDKSLYVVAYQQDLHFRQLFKVLELMGYDWYRQCEHVSFGMVSFGGEALATRLGHVVYLDDLLTQAVDKARAIIDEKSPDLTNKAEVARQVGIGAVVFFDLYNNRIKDIDFTWERALNFDGETGPYVQYTHARACSVLRKAEGIDTDAADFAALSDPYSQDVVRLIEQFPDILKSAVNRSEPSMVTRFSVDLAQAFNKFYYENKVMVDEPGTRAARLMLTDAVRQTLKVALYLIGIEAPEKM